MRYTLWIAVALLFYAAGISSAYDLVLKNGKTIHGTLVSQDDQTIVLLDNSGVKMNFKKANVDLDKTTAANQVQQVSTPVAPKTAPPVQTPAAKKPARKITEEDLKKLHDKYDLGAGMTKEGGDQAADVTNDEPATEKNRSDADWKSDSQQLQSELKAAQGQYDYYRLKCEEAQHATIQTHQALDANGNPMDLKAYIDQVCGEKEKAQGVLDGVKDEYRDFLKEASEHGVPPGDLRDANGSDPDLDKSDQQSDTNQQPQ